MSVSPSQHQSDANVAITSVFDPATGYLNVNAQSVDNTATGTISTQNLNPNSGTATANSTVEIILGAGQNTLAIQTVGTYTGALTLQGTVDGTNWISFAGTPLLNANTGLWLATITSALQSVFFAKCSGFTKMRISANAAVTGSVVVSIGASAGDSFQGALGVLTTGTTRVLMNGYIFDEVAGTALTENDAAAARIDSKRALVYTLEDETTRGQRATVTSTKALKVENQTFPTATTLNTYSVRITTNTTTTPTASTAYISSIAVSTEAIGTTSTIKIQDKQGTPLVLVPAVVTTTQGLVIYNFGTAIKMVSGIDIITAGAAAATVDVWINYYQ
jgi:hypothetical protein